MAWVTLLTSASTLVCCALPALLVSLGMGAVLAGLVSNVPGLVWISQHKLATFTAAGAMLLLCGAVLRRAARQPCPTDPQLRAACTRGRRYAAIVYIVSVALFACGLTFAFVLPLFSA